VISACYSLLPRLQQAQESTISSLRPEDWLSIDVAALLPSAGYFEFA
jgi:hypothetical protein